MPILGVIDSGKSGHLLQPSDFQSIVTATVDSGGASNVTFSSIPSTYTHLQIRIYAKHSGTTADIFTVNRFNGDSGNNYSSRYFGGTGSTTFTGINGPSVNTYFGGVTVGTSSGTVNANTFSIAITDILDYTNTNKTKVVKTLSGFDGSGSGQVDITSGIWNSTAAINSLTIDANGGTFLQYTQFALYGVI